MLATYEFTEEDARKLGSQISGSKSFGPLTITYNIDLSIPQISGNATIYGVSIGSILINPQHPSVTLGGSVGIAKAEVTLTADFSAKQLDYDADVEIFHHTVYSGKGVLFSW
ncbi:MAG: hypothetical protein IBJ09_15755 [Bacteroidia bacterium]|nr:hypothetical protein [Bacteroidia bacterium]